MDLIWWLIAIVLMAVGLIGTLLPVSAGAIFILFPAACRRVELPLTRALAHAVWPAVWPAAAMAAYLAATRPLIPVSLIPVILNMGIGALVYAATFIGLGISGAERRFYLSKIFEATSRARVLLPSESGRA